MSVSKDQKAKFERNSRQRPDEAPEPVDGPPADVSPPVIALGDLTTGPEAELGRLKASMAPMSATIDRLRGENSRLTTENQKLTADLREVKLVLAKVQAKELKILEGRGSWVDSLKALQEIFTTEHDERSKR